MGELWKATALGVLEGLTEFIPVSSTGHLVLLEHLLAFTEDKARADAFTIFIQLGAILAVVVLYPKRFLGFLDLRGTSWRDASGFRGWPGIVKVSLACLPAFLIGPLVHDTIKSVLLFPTPVAWALIAGGVAMVVIDRGSRTPSVNDIESISHRHAFLIGCFQCLALWPGMSRSGSTIIGAMLLGFSRTIAAEFSFFVAVPVMCAAVAFDLLKSSAALTSADIPIFAIGFIVSFIVAVAAIRFLMAVLRRSTLQPFGYYRIILALLVLWACGGYFGTICE